MESFFATGTLLGAISWSLGALALYATATTIYNLHFHPLRHYPGPLLHRASRFPRAVRILRGKWPREIVALAEQYGPVVRVAPNMLVYTSAEAWRDIMGHQNGAAVRGEEFAKDGGFYRSRGVAPNVLSESRENHALLRRQLSHGFSDKSLRAQEGIVRGYVDLFIEGLRSRCVAGAGTTTTTTTTTIPKTAFDMRNWFNFATFDIIGDLAFGEPFGCLAKGEVDERVTFIEVGLSTGSQIYFIKEMGLERFLGLLAMRAASFRKRMVESTAAILKRRMDLGAERPDLIEGLINKKDEWNIPFHTLRANAFLLIIAGSETTATLLSGTLYLLLKNPTAFQQLKDEIRSAFKSEQDITFASVEQLPYLLAVFKEALRVYPPVAGEMPRIVPQGGATIANRFVPAGTVVAPVQYAMNHTRANFADPFAFRPERFLPPPPPPPPQFPCRTIHPDDDNVDVLQPFGVGPRNCVGKNLAYAEMRTLLARLVFAFDMELVDARVAWLDQKVFFLWQKPPLEVWLTPVASRA